MLRFACNASQFHFSPTCFFLYWMCIANFFRSAKKRLSPKCPTDLKFVALRLKSGLCFIFGYVRNPSDFNQVLFHKTCPNMFSHEYYYKVLFFCTKCVLRTSFVLGENVCLWYVLYFILNRNGVRNFEDQ